MWNLILRYQFRNGEAQKVIIYPFLFIPVVLLMNKFHLTIWMLFSILIFQNFFFNPLTIFPESVLLIRNSNAHLGSFLRKMDLLFLIFIHVSYLGISSVLLLLHKSNFSGVLFNLFLFNTLLFGCFMLGSKLFNADIQTIKKPVIANIVNTAILQSYCILTTLIYYLVKNLFNSYFFILSILTATTIIIWFMHLRSVKYLFHKN